MVEQIGWSTVERDLEDSPVRGRPLPSRVRLGRTTVEGYLLARGGPLPYMRRLREIETETERHERELELAWQALAAEAAGDELAFERRWRDAVARRRFDAVNALIEKHNRYYPAESRLPMDPRTGDFALVDGRSYRLEPLGADWALTRFPPRLAMAMPRPAPVPR